MGTESRPALTIITTWILLGHRCARNPVFESNNVEELKKKTKRLVAPIWDRFVVATFYPKESDAHLGVRRRRTLRCGSAGQIRALRSNCAAERERITVHKISPNIGRGVSAHL